MYNFGNKYVHIYFFDSWADVLLTAHGDWRGGLAEICIKVFWRKPLKKPNSAWGWRPANMTKSGEVQYGLKYSVLSLLAPGITFEIRMIEMYDTFDLILVTYQFSYLYLIPISSIIIVISKGQLISEANFWWEVNLRGLTKFSLQKVQASGLRDRKRTFTTHHSVWERKHSFNTFFSLR